MDHINDYQEKRTWMAPPEGDADQWHAVSARKWPEEVVLVSLTESKEIVV